MKTFSVVRLRNVMAFLILVILVLTNSPAQTPQYYNYQGVGASNNIFPFAVAGGKQCQWLFLPGDFNTPTPCPTGQRITTIYFYMTAVASNTLTTLLIKFGQSNITSLPAGTTYTGQLDTVYYRASVTLTSATNAWMSITLDRPYNYDPAQSLIVDVSQCGATNTNMTLRQNTLTPVRRTYTTASACVFTYTGQDGNIVNCGIDVQPVPVVCQNIWSTQVSGTTNILQAVSSVNNLTGWIAGGAATVRRTTNGGATWLNANPNPGVVTGDVYNIFALDANTALLTTSPGATFIYRTTNGGTNWTQVFTQAGGFIDAIVMKDANTGFAYGDPVAARWSLWKTTNGGVNWDSTGLYLPQNAAEAGWNNAMKIVGNNIWFGTNTTRVYHSTNLGVNWTFGLTTAANSYALQFNDALNGMIGGSVPNKTVDGGSNYTLVTAPGTGNLTSMSGGLGSNSYWCSRGLNVYKTTDFGTTWTTAYTGTGTNNLWGMDFSTNNGCPSGWAVGANGTLLRMANDSLVGINDPNSQLPREYKLEQNYPNPFNPSTTISFRIPNAELVKLVVFDLLGREVKVLVNEFRQAGNYNVVFDASELSSGVYFYRIITNSFTESKKMLLVK